MRGPDIERVWNRVIPVPVRKNFFSMLKEDCVCARPIA
jgi:hypothetical protein